MNEAYLSLGSNKGNRMQWLEKAMEFISANCGAITKRSSVYETAAWGKEDQPDFLNMVIAIQTAKTSAQLLTAILDIETSLGRQRAEKWGPRTLDIDILFFNNEVSVTPELTIPHPLLHERRFTLLPLTEIAPEYIHPKLHKTVSALLHACTDNLEVHKYSGK